MERRSTEPPPNGSVSRELAVRLLDSHYPYRVADKRPLLFAGSLPDDPPFEVPIPSGFVLVGSAVLEPSRGRRIVEVVLDTELPAARVRETYKDLLSASDWTEDTRANEPALGGFARGPRGFLMPLSRTLRRSSRGAAVDVPGLSTVFRNTRRQSLIVSAEERGGAPTDVRLRLITGRDRAGSRRRNDPEALFVMPLLTPPPRSDQVGDRYVSGFLAPPFEARYSGGDYGGSGWEHDGAYSFAALETDLDLPSLTAHYTTQLEAAGWSSSRDGLDGPQAWSTWAFSDDEGHPWSAVFTALHIPETPQRYLLHLRADRTPDR